MVEGCDLICLSTLLDLMLGRLPQPLLACREDSSQGLKSTFFGPDGKRPMGFKEFSAFIEGALVLPHSCRVSYLGTQPYP